MRRAVCRGRLIRIFAPREYTVVTVSWLGFAGVFACLGSRYRAASLPSNAGASETKPFVTQLAASFPHSSRPQYGATGARLVHLYSPCAANLKRVKIKLAHTYTIKFCSYFIIFISICNHSICLTIYWHWNLVKCSNLIHLESKSTTPIPEPRPSLDNPKKQVKKAFIRSTFREEFSLFLASARTFIYMYPPPTRSAR